MAICYKYSLDRVFHALGDNTRRAMLSLLSKQQQLSAKHLAQSFNISQPTASKHIKVLVNSNLIIRKVEGRFHYFSLNTKTLSDAESWINRHRTFWLGSFKQLEQLIEILPDETDDD